MTGIQAISMERRIEDAVCSNASQGSLNGRSVVCVDASYANRKQFVSGVGPGMFDGMFSTMLIFVAVIVSVIATLSAGLATQQLSTAVVTGGATAIAFAVFIGFLKSATKI